MSDKNNAILIIDNNRDQVAEFIREAKKEINFNNILELDAKEIEINDIIYIGEFILSTSLDSKKKLIIINNFHLLSPLYQNKLLKPIEENPYGFKILLIANSINNILETIISRVKTINNYKSSNKNYEKLINEIIDDIRDKNILKFALLINEFKDINDCIEFLKLLLRAITQDISIKQVDKNSFALAFEKTITNIELDKDEKNIKYFLISLLTRIETILQHNV